MTMISDIGQVVAPQAAGLPTNNPVLGCVEDAVTNPFYTMQNLANPTSGSANYAIQVSKEDGGSVEIINRHTGERLNIWGDPHTNINGVSFADIHADTSIILEDGTKVTLGIVKDANDPNGFYTDTVTVTTADGAYGFQARNLHNPAAIQIQEFSDRQQIIDLDAGAADGTWWQLKSAEIGKGTTLQSSYTEKRKDVSELENGRSRSKSQYFAAFLGDSTGLDTSLSLDEQRKRMYRAYEAKIRAPRV